MLTLAFWMSSLVICSWCLWLMSLIDEIAHKLPIMFLLYFTTIIICSSLLGVTIIILELSFGRGWLVSAW